jgi:hypothetical protein
MAKASNHIEKDYNILTKFVPVLQNIVKTIADGYMNL